MTKRLAFALLALSPLLGPPGITINPVTNPASAPVPGAAFLITARHHQSPEGFTVSGRAEGLIAGKRVTRPLRLTEAGSPTLFAVVRQWDAGLPWVLVFTVREEGHDTLGVAEGMVRIAAAGTVRGIEYPMGRIAAGVPWPRRVSAAEVDRALQAMAAAP